MGKTTWYGEVYGCDYTQDDLVMNLWRGHRNARQGVGQLKTGLRDVLIPGESLLPVISAHSA
jgi:hypothetical protein